MTIDRTARNYAADLVRRFKDGQISNDEFVDQWPSRDEDPALAGISRGLWTTYSDRYNHTLTGENALGSDEIVIYDRSVLFLQSNEIYAWPTDSGHLVNWVGWPLVLMSFGLLLPLDIWLKRRNKAAIERFKAAGDSAYWPFISKADYERAMLNLTPL